jgi:hypothetical protein
MFDVVYFDKDSHYKVIASSLSRQEAAEVARAESQRRGCGRMFLSGSASVPHRSSVLVIRTGPDA